MGCWHGPSGLGQRVAGGLCYRCVWGQGELWWCLFRVMPVMLGSGWSNARTREHLGSCCDCGAEPMETRPAMSQAANRPRRHLHPPGVGAVGSVGLPLTMVCFLLSAVSL